MKTTATASATSAAIRRNSEALLAGQLVVPRLELPEPAVDAILHCLWRSEVVKTFARRFVVVAVPTGAPELAVATADATAHSSEAVEHAEPAPQPQAHDAGYFFARCLPCAALVATLGPAHIYQYFLCVPSVSTFSRLFFGFTCVPHP